MVNLVLITSFVIISWGHVSNAQADELEEQRGSLLQVKQQITKTADQLEQKHAAEKTVLEQLENLDQNIIHTGNSLKSAAHRVKQSRKEIEQLKEKIAHYSLILERSQKNIEKRLRALYTSSGMGSLRLIFSTETPLQLAENVNFLSRIATHDKQLLASYRQRMQQFHQAEQQLEQQIANQKADLIQQKEKKLLLLQSKRERKNLVKKIKRDTSALKSLLADLEDRSARMMGLIQKLEQKKNDSYLPANKNILAEKGQIPWPSTGAIRTNFGTQKHTFGGKHKNNGLVIAAVPGTSIKAILPGRIAFSSPFKGYGNLIIIDHGYKYYSLYAQVAHLNLPVGAIVEQGDIISTSGFEGRDSYYLELRHGGTPLNPCDWLKPRLR